MTKQTSRKREKFYKDMSFLNSPDGRPARLLAEYFGPRRIFRKKKIKDTIVFFVSARIPSPETKGSVENKELASLVRYYEDARQLAFRMTEWSKGLGHSQHRFIVTAGGGGGIMEAAARGASEADGYAVGLNISLPFEPAGNRYTTPELDLEFHYFFMRKFWFLYLAKALVIFPGGFGTLDELMELLTLVQTRKLRKKVPVVVYDRRYWEKVVNFDFLAKSGTVSIEDLGLFHFSDTVDDAFKFLTEALTDAHL